MSARRAARSALAALFGDHITRRHEPWPVPASVGADARIVGDAVYADGSDGAPTTSPSAPGAGPRRRARRSPPRPPSPATTSWGPPPLASSPCSTRAWARSAGTSRWGRRRRHRPRSPRPGLGHDRHHAGRGPATDRANGQAYPPDRGERDRRPGRRRRPRPGHDVDRRRQLTCTCSPPLIRPPPLPGRRGVSVGHSTRVHHSTVPKASSSSFAVAD